MGCLNIVLGLVFRESAKPKRSISAWRAEKNGVLPTTAPAPQSLSKLSFRDSLGGRKADAGEFGVRDKSTFGFGRQGEKQAGLKGECLVMSGQTRPLRHPIFQVSSSPDLLNPFHAMRQDLQAAVPVAPLQLPHKFLPRACSARVQLLFNGISDVHVVRSSSLSFNDL